MRRPEQLMRQLSNEAPVPHSLSPWTATVLLELLDRIDRKQPLTWLVFDERRFARQLGMVVPELRDHLTELAGRCACCWSRAGTCRCPDPRPLVAFHAHRGRLAMQMGAAVHLDLAPPPRVHIPGKRYPALIPSFPERAPGTPYKHSARKAQLYPWIEPHEVFFMREDVAFVACRCSDLARRA